MRRTKGVVIALDMAEREAVSWCELMKGRVDLFKVGLQLFLHAGRGFIENLRSMDCNVFLDLKLHDIPNTVYHASYEIGTMGVSFFTVHCLGGKEMMRKAVEGSAEGASKGSFKKPVCTGVTILTSIDAGDLMDMGISEDIDTLVLKLTECALSAGVNAIVCSPREIGIIRKNFGDDVIIFTPGIRVESSEVHDQKRVLSPAEAWNRGADYIIVGRSIFSSSDPMGTLEKILSCR